MSRSALALVPFLAFAPLVARAQPAALTIDDVLRRVQDANPEIAEARERKLAASARARAQGRLPDPVIGVQAWNAPDPVAFGEAEMVMYGVEQTIPLPPKLSLRRSAESALAKASGEERRLVENRVRADATRAFYEYWRATEELAVHLGHVRLSEQILATAESQYAAGKGRQQDVLRASADLARLHADVAMIRQEITSSQAVLRALMALSGEEPLGAPSISSTDRPMPALAALEERLLKVRPEVRAAAAAESSAQASARLARLDVWMPDVMVGLTWMDMREGDDGWMPMVRVNFPLVSLGRWDARAAARHDVLAARAGRTAATNLALSQLRDAHARATAAKDIADRYVKEILPISERTLEAARASYVAGSGDFLDLLDASRTLLDARLSTDRARARYESSLADLELAVGGPLTGER